MSYNKIVKNYPQLIICGSIAIDRVMNFAGKYKDVIKPDKIHVLSLSVLLDGLTDTDGGTGGNIAYTLALLGDASVLVGSVGKDADTYLKKLSRLGVNTSYVHISDRKTASFTVMTDQDDNQVGGFYPGAMSDSRSQTLAPWAGQNVLVTVSAHDPAAMKKQVAQCRELGLRLFYDVSQQVANIDAQDIREGVSQAELLMANDYELAVLCDKIHMSQEELKSSVPVVVTTKGKEGSVIEGVKVEKPISVPVAPAKAVLDPTGAGDAYRAGFLYGYRRGWELEACARLGGVTASFAIEHRGTQSHSCTKEEIAQRYMQAFGKSIAL